MESPLTYSLLQGYPIGYSIENMRQFENTVNVWQGHLDNLLSK